MAKTTKDLQATWWEWLSMSERLLTALHRQTVALTLRKVEKIEEIQTDLDDLMDKMQELDDKAAALARGLAEELGVEPSLRSLVNVLEKAEAQQVQALANRVVVVGRLQLHRCHGSQPADLVGRQLQLEWHQRVQPG